MKKILFVGESWHVHVTEAKGFDTFTIIIENEGRQNLVYKNAISTITPTKPVKLMENLPAQSEDPAQE